MAAMAGAKTDPAMALSDWVMATHGHQQCRHDHDQSLAAGAVNQRTRWRLGHQSGYTGQGHDQADTGRVPFVNRQQVDREVRTESVANIRQEKVEAVQGTVVTKV
jgi:hypothetical protein